MGSAAPSRKRSHDSANPPAKRLAMQPEAASARAGAEQCNNSNAGHAGGPSPARLGQAAVAVADAALAAAAHGHESCGDRVHTCCMPGGKLHGMSPAACAAYILRHTRNIGKPRQQHQQHQPCPQRRLSQEQGQPQGGKHERWLPSLHEPPAAGKQHYLSGAEAVAASKAVAKRRHGPASDTGAEGIMAAGGSGAAAQQQQLRQLLAQKLDQGQAAQQGRPQQQPNAGRQQGGEDKRQPKRLGNLKSFFGGAGVMQANSGGSGSLGVQQQPQQRAKQQLKPKQQQKSKPFDLLKTLDGIGALVQKEPYEEESPPKPAAAAAAAGRQPPEQAAAQAGRCAEAAAAAAASDSADDSEGKAGPPDVPYSPLHGQSPDKLDASYSPLSVLLAPEVVARAAAEATGGERADGSYSPTAAAARQAARPLGGYVPASGYVPSGYQPVAPAGYVPAGYVPAQQQPQAATGAARKSATGNTAAAGHASMDMAGRPGQQSSPAVQTPLVQFLEGGRASGLLVPTTSWLKQLLEERGVSGLRVLIETSSFKPHLQKEMRPGMDWLCNRKATLYLDQSGAHVPTPDQVDLVVVHESVGMKSLLRFTDYLVSGVMVVSHRFLQLLQQRDGHMRQQDWDSAPQWLYYASGIKLLLDDTLIKLASQHTPTRKQLAALLDALAAVKQLLPGSSPCGAYVSPQHALGQTHMLQQWLLSGLLRPLPALSLEASNNAAPVNPTVQRARQLLSQQNQLITHEQQQRPADTAGTKAAAETGPAAAGPGGGTLPSPCGTSGAAAAAGREAGSRHAPIPAPVPRATLRHMVMVLPQHRSDTNELLTADEWQSAAQCLDNSRNRNIVGASIRQALHFLKQLQHQL